MSSVGGWRCLLQYLAFVAQPSRPWRQIVIYTEGPASWPHLGPVLTELLQRGVHVSYVSSSPADPGLKLEHPAFRKFVIGDGHVRTLFFRTLEARLLLTTMPDLETFHIKRSAATRQYVYLHHSLVSCHMIYRPGAFDHFDVVLCSGPHHVAELRALEAQRGTSAKRLIPHGYGRLDTLLQQRAEKSIAGRRQVLVAPSWGAQGLLEQHAEALMDALSRTSFEVVVRPHPQTARLAPHAMQCIQRWCEANTNISLDTDQSGHGSLHSSALMISDWSGVALEFALGLERPVLFIDTPRKVNNPDYDEIDLEPIEVRARAVLGRVIDLTDLGQLGSIVEEMCGDVAGVAPAVADFRSGAVFNVGCSSTVAADWLLRLSAEPDVSR